MILVNFILLVTSSVLGQRCIREGVLQGRSTKRPLLAGAVEALLQTVFNKRALIANTVLKFLG